jgi:NMT1/THI5 like
MEISIWKITFLVGLLLIVIGLIGGGFEVERIRIPRLPPVPRILSFAIGFGLMGLCLLWPNLLIEPNLVPEPNDKKGVENLGGTSPSLPLTKPLTKVTVRLKWLHQAQFAGFYVAKARGFYGKAGLDVNLEPGGSNYPAIKTVVTGGEDFGVTGADQILLARSGGPMWFLCSSSISALHSSFSRVKVVL